MPAYDDPEAMTEESRFQAIAAMLTIGVLRLNSQPAILLGGNSTESSKERLACAIDPPPPPPAHVTDLPEEQRRFP